MSNRYTDKLTDIICSCNDTDRFKKKDNFVALLELYE